MPTPAKESDYFSAGSDLWIVPERSNSNFVQKLDWYLNFQIAKSAHHQTKSLPPPVQEILQKCELENIDWKPQKSEALLILSSLAIPNRWVMVLRGSNQLESWVQTAVQKWKEMNSPSVRVFLPHGLSIPEFEKLWKKSGGPSTATVFADIESLSHG